MTPLHDVFLLTGVLILKFIKKAGIVKCFSLPIFNSHVLVNTSGIIVSIFLCNFERKTHARNFKILWINHFNEL